MKKSFIIAAIVAVAISQNVVLLTSNASSVKVSAPIKHTVVLDATANTKSVDYLGSGAQWIWVKEDAPWPSGYQAIFEASIKSDCPAAAAQLTVAGQSIFAAYLNGDQVGYGTTQLTKYPFTVSLKCGVNKLKVAATSKSEAFNYQYVSLLEQPSPTLQWNVQGSTPNILFSLTQDQTQCYKCDNPLLAYNKQTCQCQPIHHHHRQEDDSKRNRCLQTNEENSQIQETSQTAD